MIPVVLIGSFIPLQKLFPIFMEHPSFQIQAVFLDKNHDTKVLKECSINAIPVYDMTLLQSERGKEELLKLKPHWIFILNSTVILNSDHLSAASKGTLNLHPGLLPEYAGLHVHQWAIRNLADEFGVTLHWVNEGVDRGDIAYQNKFPLNGTETGISLFLKTMNEGVRIVRSALMDIVSGVEIPSIEQDFNKRKLYKNKDAMDGRIDWQKSSAEIEAFVRASIYTPFRSPTYTPFSYLQGQKIYIGRVEIVEPKCQLKSGEVIPSDDQNILVGTGDGAVHLIKAKDENGNHFVFPEKNNLKMDIWK